MGKKNDTTFEFQTRTMSESIDLCLMLFCYLYSRKNAFEKANSALHLKKYIEFFRTIERLDLFKNTKIAIDKKYQFMITALLNGETAENYKDESHFFHDLENEVKIHNQYSKKQIKILLSLSSFMILIGLIYIFSLIKEWVIAKSISISEIILVGIPSIFGIVIGISFIYKCVLSLKVYFRKEMNPVRRSSYHDIDIEYCYIILHSEMKRVYSEINTSHYTKDLVTHLRGMIDQYEKLQQQNNHKLLNAINEIKEKMTAIDAISNTIEEINKNICIPDIIFEMFNKKAPLTFMNGEVRCVGSGTQFIKWYIKNGYYDRSVESGDAAWICKNIKQKDGTDFPIETIQDYLADFSYLSESERRG